MKEYINNYLREYIKQDIYPWHMPGHKRKLPPWYENDDAESAGRIYQMDFTEAKGLDDLHVPEYFIKKALGEIAAA